MEDLIFYSLALLASGISSYYLYEVYQLRKEDIRIRNEEEKRWNRLEFLLDNEPNSLEVKKRVDNIIKS